MLCYAMHDYVCLLSPSSPTDKKAKIGNFGLNQSSLPLSTKNEAIGEGRM